MTSAQPSQALIIQLFDRQPDSVVWFYPVFESDGSDTVVDFAVHYFNKATEQLLGASLAEVAGERLLRTERFGAEARNHIFEQCLLVWNSGEQRESTYYNAALDRWFNVQRSRVLDGVLSISRDRSAEMRAEIESQRQARLLQSIIANMPSGFSYYEAVRNEAGKAVDLKLKLCNQKTSEITGFSMEELYGETARTLLERRGNGAHFEQVLGVVDTGVPVYIEFFSPVLQRWIAYSVAKFEDGLMANYIDITATKESAEQLERIFNASLNGMMALEARRDAAGQVGDFTFVEVNRAFTRILGLERDQVIGRSYLEVFPHALRHGIFDLHVRVLESGEAQEVEFLYDVDGVNNWYRICVAPMGPERLVQTFWDVTENYRQRGLLEAANTELRRSNERLAEFTHVASHDLKEPLRKVLLYSNLLEERYADQLNEEGRGYLQRVQLTGRRMQLLISDLLVFAQVSRQPASFASVSLADIVQGVLGDLETAIGERGARIEVAPLPQVPGDALQLRQLFQNLLSNALKFHPEGGHPEVRVGYSLSARTALTGRLPAFGNAEQYHVITVRDNGIGFAPEQAGKIFQLFHRLHARSEFEGTGIGLAIVQKVVENHQGAIRAESEEGNGAVFTVLLPAGRMEE